MNDLSLSSGDPSQGELSQGELSQGDLGQFVERARQLYTLPAVAMKVLELTNHPKVDIRALKECIENDPALTTKILRAVNSSLFGLSRKVTDLNQALALLGIKPLKLLVLGFSLPKNLFVNVESEVLARYWRHTLTKAVAGRLISEKIWSMSGDEAFIGGLLQDIGMLVLIQDLGATYVKFLESVYAQGGDLPRIESSAMGFDHAMLSARLLDHWNLPQSLVQAIGQPYDADCLLALSEDQQALPQILHLAELLAVLLTQQREGALQEILDAAHQYRGLTVQQLHEIVELLEEKVQQLADVLSLQLPIQSDYSSVLVLAHEQLALVATDVAAEIQREKCHAEALLKETRDLSDALAQFTGRGGGCADRVVALASQSSLEAATPQAATGDGRASAAAQMAALVADPGLLGRVTAAVSACRRNRTALSLLLIDIDRYDDLVLTQTLDGASRVVQWVEKTIAALNDPIDVRMQIDDHCFGVILQDCERPQAVELGRNVMHSLERCAAEAADAFGGAVTVSVGLASLTLPPKNFPGQDLIDAAQRCLFGARSCGGGVLKSINIY